MSSVVWASVIFAAAIAVVIGIAYLVVSLWLRPRHRRS
jgi:hypothetical protein